MTAPRLYLDHAATTPVLPAARDAWLEGVAAWANPSSPHQPGRAARALLEDARRRIAAALDWPHEVILTSGASEAIALALDGAVVPRRMASTVEHDAVLRRLDREGSAPASRLPVDSDGRVDPQAVRDALADGPALVAVQAVNSETGVIQDLDGLAAAIRESGGIWLCDCAQSAGKRPLPDADLIIVSAHKLGGPPGIGALLVRDLAALKAGGGQEKGYRAGTENMPGALGFAAALEQPMDWLERASVLRARLDAAIADAGGAIVAQHAPRLPTIASYRMPGVPSQVQLIQFDLAGIAVSAGSACSSGTLKASPVLKAMGWETDAAGEVVRVSFGPDTDEAGVDRFAEAWRAVQTRALRTAGAA